MTTRQEPILNVGEALISDRYDNVRDPRHKRVVVCGGECLSKWIVRLLFAGLCRCVMVGARWFLFFCPAAF